MVGARFLPIVLMLISAPVVRALPAEKVKLPGSRADLERGEKLYQGHCALCHGTTGDGGRGPALNRPKLPRAPDDAALVKVVEEGIQGTEMQGAWQMAPKEHRQVAAFVRSLGRVPMKPLPGDVGRGEAIYQGKGNCASCHAIRGRGGVSGPDLTDAGSRRSATYLRASLLAPEEAVAPNYLQVRVVTKAGTTLTGARLNEDSFSIQIRDANGGVHSVWKNDIAQLDKQRGKSPMPSYKGVLSDSELDDLIAYLASLREGS